MGRCAKCGADISASDVFCPKCGTRQAHGSEIVVTPGQGGYVTPAQGGYVTPAGGSQIAYRPAQPVAEVSSAFDAQMQHGRQGAFATVAPALLHTDNEQLVWEDKPAPVALLLSKLIVGWAIVIFVSFYVATQVQGWELYYNGVIIAIALVNIAWRYWELASISYRVSSQRLEVTQGRFGQTTQTYELMRMGENPTITTPFLLRMAGRGNLTIRVPQGLTLMAIKDPKAVRDLLRRAGQIEVSRWDKIHLR
ncbi:MAG: zinc ribbon domain-containing protein [Candidatus Acidiferrales bacterium]